MYCECYLTRDKDATTHSTIVSQKTTHPGEESLGGIFGREGVWGLGRGVVLPLPLRQDRFVFFAVGALGVVGSLFGADCEGA